MYTGRHPLPVANDLGQSPAASKPPPQKLFRRYLYPLLGVTGLVIVAGFLCILTVRKLGVCAITINGTPKDSQSFSSSDMTCTDLFTAGEYTLMFLSGAMSYGGPAYVWFLFYPFYLAFPEVVTLRRRRNQYLLLASFAMVLTSIAAIVTSPVNVQATAVSVCRTVLVIYLDIVIPLIWKREIKDRDRNPFIIQMEHDWECCNRKLTFRPKYWDRIELIVMAMMMCKVLLFIVATVLDISLSLVILAFVLALLYCLWTEKDMHFYRDYTYTYLLAMFPNVILTLCKWTWSLMHDLMISRTTGGQIVVLLVYNTVWMVLMRLVRRWARNSVRDKVYTVSSLFSYRFIETFFQYLLLYSLRNIRSPTFLTAWVMTLFINVLDTTGLLNDLQLHLHEKFKRSRLSPAGAASHRRGLQHLASLRNASHLDNSLNNSSGGRHLHESFGVSSGDADVDSNTVCHEVMLTLEMIYQKCYCMILVSILLALGIIGDIYLEQMTGLHMVTACSISCNFQNPVSGWIYVIYKVLLMMLQYVIVASVALTVWKMRLKLMLKKFPSLQQYVNPDFVSSTIGGGLSTGSDIVLTESNIILKGGSAMSLESQTTTGDDVEAVAAINSRLPADQGLDDSFQIERQRILHGHFSLNWQEPAYLMFMLAAAVNVCWQAVVQMADGEQQI